MSKHIFDSFPKQDDPTKKEVKAKIPELRRSLITVQQELRKSNASVMVVFAGVDGAGKHETVNLLHAWLDPRWLVTHAYSKRTDEEKQRPPFWRYWRDLPANGQIGLYLSAWYSKPMVDRVHRRTTNEQFLHRLDDIAAFERTLADNGVLLIKVWMHMDKESQKRRLEEISESPETEWRLRPGAWENWGHYNRFIDCSESIIRHSEQKGTPWLLVDGTKEFGRTMLVARHILKQIQKHLKHPSGPKGLDEKQWNKMVRATRGTLDKLDLSQTLARDKYKEKLRRLQRKLVQLQHEAQVAGLSTVLVFEGQDAAGKGGAIRRLVQGLDAQQYQVIPIAAPTDEELAHHYLWRFWRHIPRRGRVTIFDRSWYGRVLVERIEGFASDAAWQQAYQEINEFEEQLTTNKTVLCKFWIQIDSDEQLQRFTDRQNTPYKQWKITDEDWRNRKQWDAYTDAVDDMIALTHHDNTPWTIVPGNDKSFARIKVLSTVCEAMERALKSL